MKSLLRAGVPVGLWKCPALSLVIRRMAPGLLILSLGAPPLPVSAQTCSAGCFPASNGVRWCGPIPVLVEVYIEPTVPAPIRTALLGPNGDDGAIESWNVATDWGNCIPIVMDPYQFSSNAIIVRYGPTSKPGWIAETCKYPSCGAAPGACENAIGGAVITFSNNNQLFNWSTMPANLIRSTALHELGHALGLSDDYCDQCANTVMYYCVQNPSDPAFCSKQTSPAVDASDPEIRALESLYGNLCNSVCGQRVRRWVRPTPSGAQCAFTFGSFAGCAQVCPCPAAERTPASMTADALTYEIAMQDSTQNSFALVATFSDSVWNSGRYTKVFTDSHTQATFRLRTLSGATVLEESFSYPPVDIVARTTDVGWPDAPTVPWGIRAIAPNPSRHGFAVIYRLPAGQAARIEIVDVAGRVLASREAGVGSGAEQTVRFMRSAELRAGLYIVRLAVGGRVIGRKVTIVH